jgi:hypothetical protein
MPPGLPRWYATPTGLLRRGEPVRPAWRGDDQPGYRLGQAKSSTHPASFVLVLKKPMVDGGRTMRCSAKESPEGYFFPISF